MVPSASMARLFLVPGLLGSIVFLFWVWALFDVIATDSLLVRSMQKGTWIFLVVFVPTIGAVAWVLFGRPEGASMMPGGQTSYANNPYRSERLDYPSGSSGQGGGSRALGPEDSPGWSKPSKGASRPSSVDSSESLAIRERKIMEKEAELAKREAELKAKDEGPDSAAD